MKKAFYIFPVIAFVFIAGVLLLRNMPSPDDAKYESPPVGERDSIKEPDQPRTELDKKAKPTPRMSPTPEMPVRISDHSYGRQVQVNVYGKNNSPFEGARVKIYSPPEILLPEPLEPVAADVTSKSGTVNLGSDLSGDYIVTIGAEEKLTASKKINLKDGKDRVRINHLLNDGFTLKGRIINKDKKPVPGAVAGPLHDPDNPGPGLWEFTTTDQNGSFSFSGLAPESYGLQVYAEGYQPYVNGDIRAPNQELVIQLEKGGWEAKGIAAGSLDGSPVAGMTIMLVGNGFSLVRKTGEDGTFRFRNLPAGKYYVEPVKNDSRVGRPVAFDINNAPVTGLIVKINQGITVSGTVKDSRTDVPIGGVSISITGKNQESVKAVSEPSGAFFFPAVLPDKRISVKLISPDYKFEKKDGSGFLDTWTISEYMPDSDIENLVLPVAPVYEVKGEVQGVKDLKQYEAQIDATENLNQETERDLRVKTVTGTPDDKGFFNLKITGSGNYRALLVKKENREVAGEPVEFELAPGKEPQRIILKYSEPHLIKGRVFDHEGKPLQNAGVTSRDGVEQKSAEIDADGFFSVTSQATQIEIEVSSPDYDQTISKSIDLPAEEEIVFRFRLGNLLGGRVIDRYENPVPGATVYYEYLDPEKGAAVKETTTSDVSGEFEVTGITAESLDRLICEGPGSDFGTVVMKDVNLPAENLKIVLTEPLTVEVLILNANNDPFFGGVTLVLLKHDDGDGEFDEVSRHYQEVKGEPFLMKLSEVGLYRILVKTPEGETGYSEPFEAGDEGMSSIVVQMSVSGKIYGAVFDAVTNEPLSGAQVVVKATIDSLDRSSRAAVTNTSGNYQMDGISDGNYSVEFIMSGYETQRQQISFSYGEADVPMPHQVYLEPAGGGISGEVLDPMGQPESDVKLLLIYRGEGTQTGPDPFRPSQKSGRSGDDGRFQFTGLEEGEYLLIADKQELSARQRVVILDQGEMVEVTVNLVNKILVRGSFTTEQKELLAQPIIMRNLENHAIFTARIEEDGSFQVMVSPGEYSVSVGETEISGIVNITDDQDEYFLDLSF